jgi:hypothetical protein
MMRSLHRLIGLGALVLGAGSAAVAGTGQSGRAAVYSVAVLHARLVHSPAAWAGRVVEVRGIAVGSGCATWPSPESSSCQGWPSSILVDPARPIRLPLTLGAPDPLLALLRRLPLAGQLVPPPQVVQWGAVATYRVQLRAMPDGSCATATCYQALLVDAAPDALLGE